MILKLKDKNYIHLARFVILLSFVLCVLNMKNGHNWGGDFSLYFHQAKSIIEGNSEQLAIDNGNIIKNSTVHTFSPTLAPWGFPILLAPFYAVFNLNFTAFKILETLFLIGAFIMMLFTFRKNNLFGEKYNFFFIAILGVNIVYIKAVNNILTGIPFLFFSFLSLFLILSFLRNPYKKPWFNSIILGLVLFFSFNIRTEGIGLFIALLVGQLQYIFKNKKNKEQVIAFKHIVFIVPYLTAIVMYFALKLTLASGFTSHFNHYHLVNWDTSILNLKVYFQWTQEHLIRSTIPYLTPFIFLISLIGIITRINKDLVLIIYFIFLIVVFAIWPFRDLRYLFTIYPFIVYFLMQGIIFLLKISNHNLVSKYVALFILWSCISSNIIKTLSETYKHKAQDSNIIYGPETPESKEMFNYIKNNTEKQDVIGFFKPRVMHFYTERLSFALFGSTSEIIEKANYYVETKAVGTYFQIPIEKNFKVPLKNFELLYSNNAFNVYKITPYVYP